MLPSHTHMPPYAARHNRPRPEESPDAAKHGFVQAG